MSAFFRAATPVAGFFTGRERRANTLLQSVIKSRTRKGNRLGRVDDLHLRLSLTPPDFITQCNKVLKNFFSAFILAHSDGDVNTLFANREQNGGPARIRGPRFCVHQNVLSGRTGFMREGNPGHLARPFVERDQIGGGHFAERRFAHRPDGDFDFFRK